MPRKIFHIIVYIFAAIGFLLTAGYFAVRFGLTNVRGIIDIQQQSFLDTGRVGQTANAVGAHSTNETNQDSSTTKYYWQTLPEWETIKIAVQKDAPTINRAAMISGVPARMIVASLIVEQLRFFTDDRESFKKFFEPLKILGSETQFSWGVMGVKKDTAVEIENNLKNPNSLFYLGAEYEHLLDFKTNDVENERFARMTDQHNHYFSYLYAGLYLREVEKQWQSAGYNISARPEILSTLYNIGFANSKPNANPSSGGAAITLGTGISGQSQEVTNGHVSTNGNVGTGTISFGALAAEFYNSDELLAEFPR
jgi:hypothetical protein